MTKRALRMFSATAHPKLKKYKLKMAGSRAVRAMRHECVILSLKLCRECDVVTEGLCASLMSEIMVGIMLGRSMCL